MSPLALYSAGIRCVIKACLAEDTSGQVVAVVTWTLCAGQMSDTCSKPSYAVYVRAAWQGPHGRDLSTGQQ